MVGPEKGRFGINPAIKKLKKFVGPEKDRLAGIIYLLPSSSPSRKDVLKGSPLATEGILLRNEFS